MPLDYDDDFDDLADRIRRKDGDGSAGLGVASFLIAVLSGITIAGLGVVLWLAYEEAGGQLDDESEVVVGGICGILMSIGLSGLGGILGLIGLVGRYRGKIFAGLGVGLNFLIVLGAICLLALAAG